MTNVMSLEPAFVLWSITNCASLIDLIVPWVTLVITLGNPLAGASFAAFFAAGAGAGAFVCARPLPAMAREAPAINAKSFLCVIVRFSFTADSRYRCIDLNAASIKRRLIPH